MSAGAQEGKSDHFRWTTRVCGWPMPGSGAQRTEGVGRGTDRVPAEVSLAPGSVPPPVLPKYDTHGGACSGRVAGILLAVGSLQAW